MRIGKVFRVHESLFVLSEEVKTHRGSHEVLPDANGWWSLPAGHYEVVMENVIHVGENEAGWVITRSTLNRNGVFLTSGLYDTGYHGVMAGMMHIMCGAFRVQRGTRIGQYISFQAEALKKYDGSYGIGKDHDKKYGEQVAAPVIPDPSAPLPKRSTKSTKEGAIDRRKTDMPIEELAKIPKDKLNWYQIKKVNEWKRKQEALAKNDIDKTDKSMRQELEAQKKADEEAHRRDSVQAVATHIVTPAKGQ